MIYFTDADDSRYRQWYRPLADPLQTTHYKPRTSDRETNVVGIQRLQTESLKIQRSQTQMVAISGLFTEYLVFGDSLSGKPQSGGQ